MNAIQRCGDILLEGRWYAYVYPDQIQGSKAACTRYLTELYLNMSSLIRFRGAKLV